MEPYSALTVMEGGRRLAGTGAHRGREHPDCDSRLLGVLWSQLSQGCFASIEMALNGAGGQLGIFKKGRMQQGLRICKAVKHHCFFKKKKKEKKKNILSPRQVTEVQTWVPPLGTFSR